MIVFMCTSAVLHVINGYFAVEGGHISDNWRHVVLNYMGPGNGQGIRIYKDGVQIGSDVTVSAGTSSQRRGRVVVGMGILPP